MNTIFKLLGFIWLLPATILTWLFYILPLVITKQIKYVGKADTFVWEFSNPINPSSWYDKMWSSWAGWSGPCVIIIREDMYALPKIIEVTRKHELQHCKDQFILGIFFYPAYFLVSAWLGISNYFRKYENKTHIYYFNIFEMRARKTAGQLINIPRNKWMNGKDDYNPWM